MNVLDIFRAKRQQAQTDDTARYREIILADPIESADELMELARILGITDEQIDADIRARDEFRRAEAKADSVATVELRRLCDEFVRARDELNATIRRHKIEMESANGKLAQARLLRDDAQKKISDLERMKNALINSGCGWICAG